jgi:chromate reductase, NAD(P)H dehydrogenase (quinone)
MNLEIFDLEGIPPFNQDTEQNMPEKVKDLKTKIMEDDAILIATPEYNYSSEKCIRLGLETIWR